MRIINAVARLFLTLLLTTRILAVSLPVPLLLIILLVTTTPSALASQGVLYYLYSLSLPEEQQLLQDGIEHHIRNAEFPQALTLSQSLLEASEPFQESAPEVYGMILVNHSIIQGAIQDAVKGADRDYEQGLLFAERGLEFMGRTIKPFSRQLTNALMVRGITQMELSDYEAAEDSFRRAQHIAHRHGGVYAPDQIPIVDYITVTQLRRRKALDADREQMFNLLISERAHGPESLELVPLLNSLGNYFASRGDALSATQSADVRLQRDSLFKKSIAMFQRAVAIIEQNFGINDLRLVQPLRGVANARIRQVANRKQAEAALKRSLAIVLANPDSDLSDRAKAMVDLGDLYIVTSVDGAAGVYLEAWHLLQETPETRLVAEQLFGTPTRLYPKGNRKLYLPRRPTAASGDGPIYATLEYSVTEKGKVNHLRVIEKNLSNEQVRLLKIRLRASRFRPRIVNGQLVTTEGIQLRQLYHVIKEPSAVRDKEPSAAPDKEPSAARNEEPAAPDRNAVSSPR